MRDRTSSSPLLFDQTDEPDERVQNFNFNFQYQKFDKLSLQMYFFIDRTGPDETNRPVNKGFLLVQLLR